MLQPFVNNAGAHGLLLQSKGLSTAYCVCLLPESQGMLHNNCHQVVVKVPALGHDDVQEIS